MDENVGSSPTVGARIVIDGREGPTVTGKPRVATERKNGSHYK